MTEEELGEIAARAERATPGPWQGTWIGIYGGKGPLAEGLSAIALSPAQAPHLTALSEDEEQANIAFCAHAREDVPALVTEVRALNERVRLLMGEKGWATRQRKHLAEMIRNAQGHLAVLKHENNKLRARMRRQQAEIDALKAERDLTQVSDPPVEARGFLRGEARKVVW